MIELLLRKGAKWKAGLASALVWGSGQLWNRQYVKAAFFFLMQIILIIALPSLQYGLWGLFTLGETEMIIQGSKVTQGDNSIILMILGIVWAMVAILFACIYYANIKDAIRDRSKLDQGISLPNVKEWIHTFKEKSLPCQQPPREVQKVLENNIHFALGNSGYDFSACFPQHV